VKPLRKFAWWTIKILQIPFVLVCAALEWLSEQTGA
jgi:hypothetical protein